MIKRPKFLLALGKCKAAGISIAAVHVVHIASVSRKKPAALSRDAGDVLFAHVAPDEMPSLPAPAT